MDDPQDFEKVHPFFSAASDRLLRRIYRDASLSLAVSHEMRDYLAVKFERPSTTFFFGPPDGVTPRDPLESATLKCPPKTILGYAGSMVLGYADGIRAIIPALEATGSQLVVYARDTLSIDHPLIVGRGYLPPEDLWPAVKAECDAVILPYPFGESHSRIYRTHFPTKIAEYCWSGMPMVFCGPEYATGIRWAKQHPSAGLTSTNPAELQHLLQRLAREPDLRVSLAAEGARIASSEFEPQKVRLLFRDLMILAAQPRSESGHR